jgi:hypothetical protein
LLHIEQVIIGAKYSKHAWTAHEAFTALRCGEGLSHEGHPFSRAVNLPDTTGLLHAAAKLFVSAHDLQAAEKLALSEEYGRQAVHNCCVMNSALAAAGRYSFENALFPQPV